MSCLYVNKNIYCARGKVQWYNLIEKYSKQTHTLNSLEILRFSLLVMACLHPHLEILHDYRVSPLLM
jgi:hypothetical protein